MFTRQTALQVAPQGVRVNCIAPGAVLTERTAGQMPPQVQEQVARFHPLGRLGTPADIASAALFLASDVSSWITGVTLDIAGGKVML
jgi:3-oxoacyl-[acyl-carrier protein] reductase